MSGGEIIGVAAGVALIVLIWALAEHEKHKDAMK